MRISLVISSLRRGGAERIMSLLANAWAEQGREVTIITLDQGVPPAYPIHSGVTIEGLGLLAGSKHLLEGLLKNTRRVRNLRRAIRKSKPDLVISFVDVTNVLTLLATRRLGMPIIVSERVDPSQHDIGPIWNCLRLFLYRFADAVVCQTPSIPAWFNQRTRIKWCIIPNPVVVPCGLSVSQSRRIKDTPGRVLIAMGRLTPQKGFDILLETFSIIAGRHPEWSLTILGDGPLKRRLEAQATFLGLKGRVCFPGEVSDPFSALRAADLFVLSSRFEGFPNALCEAMACGLPVVSFNCPSGPADIIRDGIDGILVAPEDATALAIALDRLMSDAQERERLALRATAVTTRFSLESIVLLWEQLFEELLLCEAHPIISKHRILTSANETESRKRRW
jgi:GalNAc-alpha-(1->4)-GalNAc-alpha-(1->3)-diNAcBac-PP-undecaprenol alpha-1,4-N-acetyl-D-galactosaminyltransferase